mmetsp:Transcript_12112/g.18396  ORF Transcript_12112/g.18396 Transcript_12112/m.18396 type:complete len:835 (+) Transcript_12112:156-2660(+)
MGASASREKFSESITSLIEQDVSPDNAEFWDELWKIPSSAEEVFELISPEAARLLRDQRFDNLATLFTQAIAQLCQIVETPYSIYFDQALNCVRVLTRILPFLLERGDLGNADENVENLCWGTAGDNDDASSFKDSIVGRVVGGADHLTREEEEDAQEPLALLVVHAAMHMLFLPQFTCEFFEENNDPDGRGDMNDDSDSSSNESVDSKEERQKKEADAKKEALDEEKKIEKQIEEQGDSFMRKEAGLRETRYAENGIVLLPKPATIVWAGGIGVKTTKFNDATVRKFDKNRIEVLRLLLAACCDPLFSPSYEYNPLASRWLGVATAADSPNAICLFYSLFNTVMSYDPKHGIGVPYSGAFASDSHARLVTLSAQVLCVLLDCGLSGDPQPVKNDEDEPIVEFEEASKTGFNLFRTIVARIDSRQDLTAIYKGLTKLLWSVHESRNTMLPGSKQGLQCYQEVLVIFWKILEENPIFMNHVLQNCDVSMIVVPVCYLMYTNRQDPSQIGLIHLCTFLLLKLSGERSFGVGLNKIFNTKLPCDIPIFGGGHADLIAITLHKMVVNGSQKLIPLYSCFFTIICNISPYWRSMSLVAAVKLVNLFEVLSSPKFLFSEHKAFNHLALLLEVFNNVIQYQYHGSQHLVYAIIRKKDIFGRLATMSLGRAKSLCEKVYGKKIKAAVKEHNRLLKMKKANEEDDEEDENDSDDTDSDGEEGRSSHFKPTEEWLSEFKEKMPLETIKRLLQHLTPVIDEIINREEGIVDEGEILAVLNNVTMVGLLPVPHAIVIRKYQPNQYTSLWFTAYLWGIIFVGHQSLPIFDGEAIELFQVSTGKEEED